MMYLGLPRCIILYLTCEFQSNEYKEWKQLCHRSREIITVLGFVINIKLATDKYELYSNKK